MTYKWDNTVDAHRFLCGSSDFVTAQHPCCLPGMKRVALIAAVVLAGFLVFGSCRRRASRVTGRSTAVWETEQGQPLEVKQPYTWGSTLLLNEGKKPAVVERVRLLGVTGSFELLAVHTRPVP